MFLGVVSTDGVPAITLPITGQDWIAIADTGFNGDLELPEDLRNSLNTRYVGRVTSALDVGKIRTIIAGNNNIDKPEGLNC